LDCKVAAGRYKRKIGKEKTARMGGIKNSQEGGGKKALFGVKERVQEKAA